MIYHDWWGYSNTVFTLIFVSRQVVSFKVVISLCNKNSNSPSKPRNESWFFLGAINFCVYIYIYIYIYNILWLWNVNHSICQSIDQTHEDNRLFTYFLITLNWLFNIKWSISFYSFTLCTILDIYFHHQILHGLFSKWHIIIY